MGSGLGLSILTTSAPKSLSIVPQNGTGARPPNSNTFTPFNGVVDIHRLKIMIVVVIFFEILNFYKDAIDNTQI